MSADKVRIFPTIREQVYNQIKRDILGEKFPPGYHLQEEELAASLGVSRSPVREALKSLAAEGLTENIPHKGVIVKVLTAREVEEVCEFRAIIEYEALRQAIKVMDDQAAAKIRTLCEQLEASHSLSDFQRYSDLDGKFHDYPLALWGNQTIYKMWKTSYYKLHSFRIRSLWNEQRFKQSLREHLEIGRGLITKDLELAWKWNEIHLFAARDTILEHISH